MSDRVILNWKGDEIRKRAKSLIGASTWSIGLAVLSDAKLLCPVDHGYLAASIMAASSSKSTPLDSPRGKPAPAGHRVDTFKEIQRPDSLQNSQEQVFVGTAVDYGPHQEYGTIKMDAQPFLRPALDMARGKVPALVERDAKIHFAEYLYQHDAYVAGRSK